MVLVAAIAIGMYFFGGAWGLFLLWCLALLFVLPQGMAASILFEGSREERKKGRRAVGAAYLACAVLWILIWLAGVGYCGYHVYRAYQALT